MSVHSASSSGDTVLFFFFFFFFPQHFAADRDWWLSWFVALHYTDRSTDCWQTAQLNASARHGHLHSAAPTVSPLRCDLLELSWMTTALHPSLSLRHKRVLCGAGCCCLLVSLCHHYGVTDRITRMGVRGRGRRLCNRSRGRSHLGPQESDHPSIHLHAAESQMETEHSVTRRGGRRTQSSAQNNIHLIKLNLHWEPAMRLKTKLCFLLHNKVNLAHKWNSSVWVCVCCKTGDNSDGI